MPDVIVNAVYIIVVAANSGRLVGRLGDDVVLSR